MSQPFKAWIIPIEEGAGGQPPGIWGGGNAPMPTPPIPIYPGGTPNPPGIWGPNDPRPGWGLPPTPPGTWGGSGQPFPTPPIPIYPGGTPNPPGIWGGGNQPFPTPPIHFPPGIWGGAGEGFPTPPIVIPPLPGGPGPSNPINKPPTDDPRWIQGYIPGIGWVWVMVPPKGDATPPPEEE